MIKHILVVMLVTFIHSVESMEEFWPHSYSNGTENTPRRNVSNSNVPHLPYISGFVGTHGTYRWLTIVEQTAVVVGEPKHGLWRFQENGMIREYRKKGRIGLLNGVDPHDPNLNEDQEKIIRENYASKLPGEGHKGYKYPDDRVSSGDGTYDNQSGYLNYIDLSIYHSKYQGAYNHHVPIDLPIFYCLISQPNFPYLENSWKWAREQPMANKVGPLGKRAGLDVKENFENVIQVRQFDDAGIWVNVGNFGGNETDRKVKNLDDLGKWAQNVNYQRVSMDKINAEIYFVERYLQNEPRIFVMLVMDNKEGPSDYSFVRNDGQYWKDLNRFHMVNQLQTKNFQPAYSPYAWVHNYPQKGDTKHTKVFGLPVYGHHHPDRESHMLVGGACPELGGDMANYPYGNPGGAFPTNYQEITPMCDGVTIDMKFTANLGVETWNDPALVLGNAAYNTHVMTYKVDKGIYGRYTDPYLVKHGKSNPVMMNLTEDGEIVYKTQKNKHEKVILKLNFTYPSKLMPMKKVQLKSTVSNAGFSGSEENTERPTEQICPTEKPKHTEGVNDKSDNNASFPWLLAIVVITAVILVVVIVDIVVVVVILKRLNRRDVDPAVDVVTNKISASGLA